jgi:hypothetical protein
MIIAYYGCKANSESIDQLPLVTEFPLPLHTSSTFLFWGSILNMRQPSSFMLSRLR